MYLKNVFKLTYPHKIQFNLVKEFGKLEIIADWYSGKLLYPKGKALLEFYLGSMINEKEVIYSISKGKIKRFYTNNNLVYKKNLLNPCFDILKDTLKMRILKNIDFSDIEKIASKDIAEIYVRFNAKGLIENIELNEYSNPYKFDNFLLSIAQKTLKNLPRLMQVTAENYQHPSVVLTFEGKCFKSPKLYKNDCSDCLKLKKQEGRCKLILILLLLIFGIATFFDKLKIL